eukprot:11176980-Lingulodinium_polyedra.AAC.1
MVGRSIAAIHDPARRLSRTSIHHPAGRACLVGLSGQIGSARTGGLVVSSLGRACQLGGRRSSLRAVPGGLILPSRRPVVGVRWVR